MSIVFVTGNKHKAREVQMVLTDLKVIMQDIDLPEIQGSDEEIIRCKAEHAKGLIKGKFIVEDSGLEYEALNGMPGPYVKWFLTSIGNDGLVKLLAGYDNKRANAVCNIAYYDGTIIHIFKGVVKGTIVESRGTSAFGWDNIFKPDGFDQTYGEMPPELKNSLSHRFKALYQLKQALNN
jgi:inosine triphosphate pyrophosphatase